MGSCLSMFGVLLVASSAGAVEVRELRFAPGATSVTVSGAVVRGTRDVYSFVAEKGQHLDVRVTAVESNAVFAVWLPGARFDPANPTDLQGRALRGAAERDEAKQWRGQLPDSGRYHVVVGPTRGNATYDLKLAITARLPTARASTPEPTASPSSCDFALSCSHQGRAFTLSMKSASGDCPEDDMGVSVDGVPLEGLARAWYLPIGNVGPIAPVCNLPDRQGYPAFALDDVHVLFVFEKSGRPGYDTLAAAVLDVKQRRLVATLELGESKNKAVAVLPAAKGFRVRVVKEHLAQVRCDCDAAFVDAWKELSFAGGKLQAVWAPSD